MEAAVSFAHARGLAIAFEVMLTDRAAIRLYERFGAQHVADVTHEYGDGLKGPAAVP